MAVTVGPPLRRSGYCLLYKMRASYFFYNRANILTPNPYDIESFVTRTLAHKLIDNSLDCNIFDDSYP